MATPEDETAFQRRMAESNTGINVRACQILLVIGTALGFLEMGNIPFLSMAPWFLAGFVVVLIVTGGRSLLSLLRNPRGLAFGVGGSLVSWGILMGAAWLGEGGAEGLSHTWRWLAAMTALSLWAEAGYRHVPELPIWFRTLLDRWK